MFTIAILTMRIILHTNTSYGTELFVQQRLTQLFIINVNLNTTKIKRWRTRLNEIVHIPMAPHGALQSKCFSQQIVGGTMIEHHMCTHTIVFWGNEMDTPGRKGRHCDRRCWVF